MSEYIVVITPLDGRHPAFVPPRQYVSDDWNIQVHPYVNGVQEQEDYDFEDVKLRPHETLIFGVVLDDQVLDEFITEILAKYHPNCVAKVCTISHEFRAGLPEVKKFSVTKDGVLPT